MKTAQKALCILLTSVFVFSFADALFGMKFSERSIHPVLTAHAEDAPASGVCGDGLVWRCDADTSSLIISGSGKMNDYDKQTYYNTYRTTAPWASLLFDSIIIEPGVESIGDYAFYNHGLVSNVTFSDTVESIGRSAFSGCAGLASVSIPGSVESIGNSAFADCGLKNLVLSEGLKSIGSNAFDNCGILLKVELPHSVTNVGKNAFRETAFYTDPRNWKDDSIYCGDVLLKVAGAGSGDYTIRPGTRVIGDAAFYGLRLNSVAIPDSVVTVGNAAFYGCGLDAVTLPDDIAYIGDEAFLGCSLSEVDIPGKVTYIGSKAFSGCSLSEAVIPVGVTVLSDYVFQSCENLRSVSLPDGLTRIGDFAFFYCTALEEIIIPDGVEVIGKSAFNGCSAMTNVYIPESVVTIGDDAFFGCTGLDTLYVPFGVRNIGIAAFGDVLNVSYSRNLLGSPWGARCLNGYVDGLCVFRDPEKTQLVAKKGFEPYRTNEIIPSGTQVIESRAFSANNAFDVVFIPLSVRQIDSFVFPGNQLTDVFYEGNEEDRAEMTVAANNDALLNAQWHYGISPDEMPKFKVRYKSGISKTDDFVCFGYGEVRLEEPPWTRAGYTFIGWSVSHGQEIFQPGDIINVTENTVVNALWHDDTPQPKVKSVSLDNITITFKSTAVLKPAIIADPNAKYSIGFSSSDPSVVTVNEKGEIYGAGRGTAKITCKVVDKTGNVVEADCTVTVKYSFKQWLIMIFLLGFLWFK